MVALSSQPRPEGERESVALPLGSQLTGGSISSLRTRSTAGVRSRLVLWRRRIALGLIFRHGAGLDRRDLGPLLVRLPLVVLVGRAREDEVEGLALEEIGGKCLHEIFLLHARLDLTEAFAALVGDAVDLGIEILVLALDLLHLGDLLEDKVLLEGRGRALEDVLIEQPAAALDLLVGHS